MDKLDLSPKTSILIVILKYGLKLCLNDIKFPKREKCNIHNIQRYMTIAWN